MLRMIAHCPAGQTLRTSQPDRQVNLQHLRWLRSRTQVKLFRRRLWDLCAWSIPESCRHLHLTLHLHPRKNMHAVIVSSSYHPFSSSKDRLSNIGQSNHGTKAAIVLSFIRALQHHLRCLRVRLRSVYRRTRSPLKNAAIFLGPCVNNLLPCPIQHPL